ncbi:MAG: M20 family metallopeptidase [Acidimicrobiales bacterium]
MTSVLFDRETLDDLVSEMLPDAVDLRREIHRHPELGIDNPDTQRRILDALSGLGLEISTGGTLTSVVADLVGAFPGPTLLLRADTDALPMTEESGEPFSSIVPGRAHACGHDSHVAMLVAAARILSEHRDELAGRVRFIFQPGEEGPGGAKAMIDEGVLDGVDAAFALHISPNLPVGYVACRPGPIMAATDDFLVTVKGKGGHASTPHFGNDPIPVACEMVLAVQTMVTRRIDAFNPAVVTVGRIAAGSTVNVIPETAELLGTIRTVSDWTRMSVTAGFERVVRNIAAAHECEIDVRMTPGYSVVRNDVSFVEFAEKVATEVLGEGKYFELPSPIMGAEDFGYILERVPGAMAFLGVCPADIENSLEAPSCHSNVMRLNEDGMAHGIAMHVGIATNYLAL